MAVRSVAEKVIESYGLEPMLTTMVFHGIGLDILEYGDPAHKTRGWTLETDMTINFEVFYRDPEVGGVHLEDTVRVTPTGLEHFAQLPREIIVTPYRIVYRVRADVLESIAVVHSVRQFPVDELRARP